MLTWFTTNKRLAIIAASTVGVVVVCLVVLVVFMDKPKAAHDADQVLAAVEKFCAAHKPLLQTVTFSQLIAQGYLGFTVFLTADDTSPQVFLMDALMPDGSHATLLSDGSVQRLSKSRFQQAAPPNGGPATPVTDSGGSGAGRHR
jgi:hypothetical protein